MLSPHAFPLFIALAFPCAAFAQTAATAPAPVPAAAAAEEPHECVAQRARQIPDAVQGASVPGMAGCAAASTRVAPASDAKAKAKAKAKARGKTKAGHDHAKFHKLM